jgi:hypothetical protein
MLIVRHKGMQLLLKSQFDRKWMIRRKISGICALHFLRDSYSHFDFAGNEYFGQTSGGYIVNHTNVDPDEGMKKGRATWDALNEFGKFSTVVN